MTVANSDLSYLDDLNPAQRQAVEYMGGPVLIFAGAGSGKTRVLTYRIVHLIRHHGVSPWSILAITFTNKAAQEMRERIFGLVGADARKMVISTFHSACARILRDEIEALGFSRHFSIYDEYDSTRLIARCIEDVGVDKRSYHPRAIKGAISAAKNEMVDEESFSDGASTLAEEVAAQVYSRYQELLRLNNALDFDDLLLVTYNLFELYPDVLERYRERFKNVLVDEYQDTNIVQYRLVRLLAQEHRSLYVVGDDDQGIYSWRGADIRNILKFEEDYPDAMIFKLEQNYRSSPEILDTAGAVVTNNRGRKDKTLWTARPSGHKPRYYMASSEHGEAAMVVNEIAGMVESGDRQYSDIAVFYRIHAQSRVLEEELIRAGMPYRIFRGTRFYERKEIKDILAYLRLIANRRDEVSLRRILNVPARGIGKTTVESVERYARENGTTFYQALEDAGEIPYLGTRAKDRIGEFVRLMKELEEMAAAKEVHEILEEVWNRTGYMEELEAEHTLEAQARKENLEELLNVVSDFRNEYGAVTLDDFLERASLVNDTDDLEEEGGYVSLMTLHNAKGLEFSAVFVVGMEDGLLPHIRSMTGERELEEERRLCYVGMTRAQELLYLSHAASRSTRGVLSANPISRFLIEIPERYLNEVEFEEAEETPEPIEVAVGESVVHAKWGEGLVLELCELEGDCEVTVEFPRIGIKKLLLSYAPLKKRQ